MSAKITGMVWDLQIPRMEAQILMAMADHADHEGRHVFPSQALIAWKTGYSLRQVRRVQDSLKQRKILIPEGSGYRGVQHYRLDFSLVPRKPPFVTRDSKPRSQDSTEDKMTAVKMTAVKMSVEEKPYVNKSLQMTKDKMSTEEPSTKDKMTAVKMSSEDIFDTSGGSTTDIFDTSPIKDARAESLDTLEPKEKDTTPAPSSADADKGISSESPSGKFIAWWNQDIVPLGARPYSIDDADTTFITKANKALKDRGSLGFWKRVKQGFEASAWLQGKIAPASGKRRFKPTLPWLLSKHREKGIANYTLVAAGEWADNPETEQQPRKAISHDEVEL